MDIAVDDNGDAYVMGYTTSRNFPTTVGALDREFNATALDVFVLKLNSEGSGVEFSTFLGGSSSYLEWNAYWYYVEEIDIRGSIALDPTGGGIYLVGETDGADFPTTSGAFDESYNGGITDMFVTKLNMSGDALVFSTFFPIDTYHGVRGHGMAVDGLGSVYVTGTTAGLVPTTPGAFMENKPSCLGCYSAFALKFSPSGTLVYCTYLGGPVFSMGKGITVDDLGNAYVCGETRDPAFPTTQGAYDVSYNGDQSYRIYGDCFVTKLNAAGTAQVYSTFIGGSDGENALSIHRTYRLF
jgi:hypothetical protein